MSVCLAPSRASARLRNDQKERQGRSRVWGDAGNEGTRGCPRTSHSPTLAGSPSPALYGPESPPRAAPPRDSGLQRRADPTPAEAGQGAQLRAGESRVGRRGKSRCGRRTRPAFQPADWGVGWGGVVQYEERSAGTALGSALGGSAGGGSVAAGTRRRRPRRPRWEEPYKAAARAALQTPGAAAQSAGRTQPPRSARGTRACPRGTNFVLRETLIHRRGDRPASHGEPLPAIAPLGTHSTHRRTPGGGEGPRAPPCGRGMRGPRHGLGGV